MSLYSRNHISRSDSLIQRGHVLKMLVALTFFLSWMGGPTAQLFGQSIGQVKGKVVDAETGDPIAGAELQLQDSGQIKTTRGDGTFNFSTEPGTYFLVVTADGYKLWNQSVTAGEGPSLTVRMEIAIAEFGEEMVIIGSRTARTALETPVPVDVLSRDDIANTGMTETSRALQFLAPSFNHSTSTISDGTDIVRPSTLRGLGPDQTLVLLNGKRRHTSALVHVNGSVGRGTAGVDLNAIPVSAIKRMEVLRDGAAAQYGSDAIAGVLNVVLKDEIGKTEVGINAGQMYEKDGETVQAYAGHGFALGSKGVLRLQAEVRDRGNTNRSGLDRRPQYPALADGSPDPREASFDRRNHRYGDADSENGYLWLNGQVSVSEAGQFYFFGGYSDRSGESGGFYRRALDGRNLPEIYPDGFLPLIETEVEDLSMAFGYRTLFGAWKFDASLTHGGNSFDFHIANSLNVSLGPNSPTEADAGTLNFDQTSLNVDMVGSLGDHISLAFGAEFRQDHYEIEAGELASYVDGGFPNQYGDRAAPGIQVFPGFRPSNEVDEDRENISLYGDLEWSRERGLIGLALRFEDYSDFGNQLSGKLAGRSELQPGLSLRGSVSTGFRAPSLHQSYFNNTSTQFVLDPTTNELVPLEVGTFRNDSQVTSALGVPELKEETSVHFSGGITARPSETWSITADLYAIDIDDRIVISGQFRAGSSEAIGSILNPLGVNAAQFFTNAIDTETRGLDLVVAHVRELADDMRLKVTMAFNKNVTEVVGEVDTPAPLEGLGETLFNRIERERIQSAQPRTLYHLTAQLNRGALHGKIGANYFGSVKTVENASDPSIDQISPGRIVTDLDFGYRFGNGLTWSIGANNIFDTYPERNRREISFNGIFTYPRRTAPFGFNGGYVYTRLSMQF